MGSSGYLIPPISTKHFLTLTLSKIALLNLLFGTYVGGFVVLVGSIFFFDFWCAAYKYNGALILSAEPMKSCNSIPVPTGFLSVHDSNDNVKLFVIASLNIICVPGLGIIVGLYGLKELIVTLTASFPNKVYRNFRFFFDVLNSNSNPRPLFFLNDLQNPKI